jgi:hypothetical protein
MYGSARRGDGNSRMWTEPRHVPVPWWQASSSQQSSQGSLPVQGANTVSASRASLKLDMGGAPALQGDLRSKLNELHRVALDHEAAAAHAPSTSFTAPAGLRPKSRRQSVSDANIAHALSTSTAEIKRLQSLLQ